MLRGLVRASVVVGVADPDWGSGGLGDPRPGIDLPSHRPGALGLRTSDLPGHMLPSVHVLEAAAAGIGRWTAPQPPPAEQ